MHAFVRNSARGPLYDQPCRLNSPIESATTPKRLVKSGGCQSTSHQRPSTPRGASGALRTSAANQGSDSSQRLFKISNEIFDILDAR